MAGLAAAAFIRAIDHWIAFGLLGAIGSKMLWESIHENGTRQKATRHSFGALLLTAIGISIDAMVVGITLALVHADILVVAAAIGLATFTMTTLGIMIGQIVGEKLGRLAEALGGIGLVAFGTTILLEHSLGGSSSPAIVVRAPGSIRSEAKSSAS